MLTGAITERREIPHEPGEWLELRLLSWRELEQARDARARKGLEHIKMMGREVYGAIQEATAAAPPQDRSIQDTYDQATLLTLGIAGWSYPAPVTPETVGQLDEETARWAMGAILGLQFMRAGDDRGNAAAPSTPTSTA